MQSFAPIALFLQLLKWLVVVYDFLEDPFILSKLYSSLITKISYETTRQWVCHLLYLSTTQALVKPWRVQYLLEAYQRSPNSIYIIGLLRLYREYAPTLVKGKLPMVKEGIFQPPSPETVSAIQAIQGRTGSSASSSPPSKVAPVRKELLKKKRLISSISVLNNVPPPLFSRYDINLGIESVTSISQFVHKYHKFKFPEQMASVFNDTGMLSRLLLYKGDGK